MNIKFDGKKQNIPSGSIQNVTSFRRGEGRCVAKKVGAEVKSTRPLPLTPRARVTCGRSEVPSMVAATSSPATTRCKVYINLCFYCLPSVIEMK
jgi:hypothetical protein